MTAANRFAADQTEESKPAQDEQKSVNFRYNVCQPRTSPVERPIGDVAEVHRQSVKTAIEEQQLQPSMLPEYFQKQMERNALINPNPDATEEDRINKRHKPSGPR